MQKGFTLLELMIVVTILGVLMAIAVPSYTNFMIKSKRGDMQTNMLNIAQELKRYQVANRNFSKAKADLGFTQAKRYPLSGTGLYNVTLTVPDPNLHKGKTNEKALNEREALVPLSWVLEATPIAGTSQQNDGVLRLNSRGHKCWTKGQTTCELTVSSKWTE